jgi:hypothetical protein
MHRVYLDANVLQISVTHRPAKESRQVRWGGSVHTWIAEFLAPWQPRQAWLREQSAALAIVGEHARAERLRLLTGPEIKFETLSLQHGRLAWTDASVLAGVEIEIVRPPFYLDRTFVAYNDQPGDAAKRRDAALSRGDDERFNQLKQAAGGNKNADAFHLRCAEHANAEYFLTVDKRLKNSLTHQKRIQLRTKLVFPTELVRLLAA